MSGSDIQRFEFAYERSPDQDAAAPVRHAVVVVGAGPVGLTLAIDLAERGQQVLLLDNDHRLSTGSRAICFAKRTLEIWDRLGVGDRMVAKGVSWNVGKVYFRDALLYSFDLLPEEGHERPAFINLQQYYAEAYLAQKACSLPNLEIRWKNNVVALAQDRAGVTLGIDTPDGRYELVADHVVACDGSRSPLRALLGQESHGRVFRDRFLIADVRMKADFPAERWFWFDPPFHRNQSALLHMQPDGVWRIDFQLGWDADPEVEKKPEHIIPRVKALLEANAAARNGAPVPEFELEWASVYTFSCLRMDCFRHGRVLFAGDSAHGVSPFGARGANSGVQDAENLAWKLDLVLRGEAADALLDSYAMRARVRGRREHPQLDARHRLHHAEERDLAAVPRCGARPGARPCVRAQARQQRPLVAAGDLARLAAEHARRRSLERRHACRARRPPMRRCSSTAGRRGCCASSDRRFTLLGARCRAGVDCASCRSTSCAWTRHNDVEGLVASATTCNPETPCCSAPTSMSARAGARRPKAPFAPRWRARVRCTEETVDADHRTEPRCARRLLRSADRRAPRPDARRRATR